MNESLEIWRKVTAGRGLGLYIHLTGVRELLAVREHLQWARVGPGGARDERLDVLEVPRRGHGPAAGV